MQAVLSRRPCYKGTPLRGSRPATPWRYVRDRDLGRVTWPPAGAMSDAGSDDEEPDPAAGPGPSSRTRRRQANKGRQFKTIPCCFKSFQRPFCRTGIARLVEQWVKDVHRILIETHMFINFHILWCLENGHALPASLNDTFFNRHMPQSATPSTVCSAPSGTQSPTCRRAMLHTAHGGPRVPWTPRAPRSTAFRTSSRCAYLQESSTP